MQFNDDYKPYEEEFVKSEVLNDQASIRYVLDAIYEAHPPELGWEIGTPVITPNSDGRTVRISVPLKQDKRNKQTNIFDTLPRR